MLVAQPKYVNKIDSKEKELVLSCEKGIYARQKELSGEAIHQFSVERSCPRGKLLQTTKADLRPWVFIQTDKRVLWQLRSAKHRPGGVLLAVFGRLL